jgi:hypothetical protein
MKTINLELTEQEYNLVDTAREDLTIKEWVLQMAQSTIVEGTTIFDMDVTL